MVVENVESEIGVWRSLPWGSHICFFYNTPEELTEALIQYFKAGLQNNELCLWVVPNSPDKPGQAPTRRIMHGFDNYLETGQLEYISHNDVYFENGAFNRYKAFRFFTKKTDEAAAKGYRGVRIGGCKPWLEKEDWLELCQYEAHVNNNLNKANTIALCAYPLKKCGEKELIEIISAHKCTLNRQNSQYIITENAEAGPSKRADNLIEGKYHSVIQNLKRLLRESEDKYLKTLRGSDIMVSITTSDEGRFIEVNDNFCRTFGYTRDEMVGHTSTELNLWSAEQRAFIVEKFKKQHRLQNEKITLRTKSGEIITVLFSIELINIGGQSRIFSVLTDITSLQNLKEKEQAIISTAADGFCIIGADTRFIEVNESYCRMTGYTRKELLRMSMFDVDVRINSTNMAQRIGKIVQQGSDSFITRVRRKDGEIINVEVHSHFYNTGRGQFFAFTRELKANGIVPLNVETQLAPGADNQSEDRYDIVIQKLSKDLQESEERYRKTASASPNIISITTLAEGKFLYINENFSRILGYTRDEVIGHTSFELNLWKDKRLRERIYKKLTTEGRIQDEVFFPRTKSGETLAVKFSGELHNIDGQQCIITVMTDITRLQELEKTQKAILDAAHDGFWITDVEGKFLEVNDSYCQMIGYTREELLKMYIRDIEALENPQEVAGRINRIIKRGPERFITQHRRKNGKIIKLEINASFYKVGKGRFYVFIRDLTGKEGKKRVTNPEFMWRNNITGLQEKFIKEGFTNFEDREIIELLLSMVMPARKAEQLARVCIDRFKNLGDFLEAPPEDLLKTGVSPTCVFAITMLHKLPIKVLQEKISEQSIFDSPEDIFNYLYYSMRDEKNEIFKVILLNSRNQIVEIIDLFEGNTDKIPIDTREVIEKAMTLKTRALVLVHNHPSGDPAPSRDDKRLTRDLVFIGNILGINVVDHIIIGNNRYYSFADAGLIKEYELDFLNLRLTGTNEAKRRISRARLSNGPQAPVD